MDIKFNHQGIWIPNPLNSRHSYLLSQSLNTCLICSPSSPPQKWLPSSTTMALPHPFSTICLRSVYTAALVNSSLVPYTIQTADSFRWFWTLLIKGLYHLSNFNGERGGDRRNRDRIGTEGVGAWVAEIVPHEYPFSSALNK